jgi:hypothetical protein
MRRRRRWVHRLSYVVCSRRNRGLCPARTSGRTRLRGESSSIAKFLFFALRRGYLKVVIYVRQNRYNCCIRGFVSVPVAR